MANLSQNIGKEDALIFLHIPKAAGSTLHKIIARQYSADEMFTINGLRVQEDIEKFKNLSLAEREKIKVLKGHMTFGLHEFLPRPSTYITILRDPVERIISHYYYVLRRPEHYLYNQVKSENIDLQGYVEKGLSNELNNGQTRLLAGMDDSREFSQCEPQILETAKTNLQQHFAVVGLSEKFDETLLLLQKTFEWGIPVYMKENVTKNRLLKENVPEATLKTIKKYNQLDSEIYNYAEELFLNQINEKIGALERDLKMFKLRNQQYRIIQTLVQPVVRKFNKLEI